MKYKKKMNIKKNITVLDKIEKKFQKFEWGQINKKFPFRLIRNGVFLKDEEDFYYIYILGGCSALMREKIINVSKPIEEIFEEVFKKVTGLKIICDNDLKYLSENKELTIIRE